MGNIRVPFIFNEPLKGGVPSIRTPLVFNEPLKGGVPNIQVPLVFNEPLKGGVPFIRTNLIFNEPLKGGVPFIRTNLIFFESLIPIPKEEFMSEIAFPGFGNSVSNPAIPAAADPFNSPLPGLAFSVHKKPSFRTRINSAASGNEVRNALMQYPIWDFELTYEFIEDSSGSDSSLKNIMGFFLSRQGSYDSWLFKDPDDHSCVDNYCGDSDGLTTEFPLSRVYGGFRERVGQIDTANTSTVFVRSTAEARTIPVTPGPYTVTATNAATFVEDYGVMKGGIPLTKVIGAPAASQYSVVAGVYTFNATDQGDAITIDYRYSVNPADYTITLPNRLVFDVAPPTGLISWSGQFFFVCRFTEDQQDYEKFYDKLWNLQECTFKSIIS